MALEIDGRGKVIPLHETPADVADVLRAAARMLDDRDHGWIKHANAVAVRGSEVCFADPLEPDVCAFCLWGAIVRACHVLSVPETVNSYDEQLLFNAARYAAHAAYEVMQNTETIRARRGCATAPTC